MQQSRLFTWLSFGSASGQKVAQFSVGANNPELLERLRSALLARSRDSAVDLRLRVEAGEALGLVGDTLRYELSNDASRRHRFVVPRNDDTFSGWLHVPAGHYLVGSAMRDLGAMQNEIGPAGKPLHLRLESFEIAFAPVTNAEFKCFVDDHGYDCEDWWSDEISQRWRRGELRDEVGMQKHRTRYEALRTNFEDGIAAHYDRPTEADRARALRFSKLKPEDAEKEIQAQYPATQDRPALWETPPYNNPLQPVVGVSLCEALAYCRWLKARSGLQVALPTEAQWEVGVRRARTRWLRDFAPSWPWGQAGPSAEHLNADAGHLRRTSPVGVFPMGDSPFGLVDGAGNVWEWTLSNWSDQGHDAAQVHQPATGDGKRAVRGGAWGCTELRCRTTSRNGYFPSVHKRNFDLGFRLIRCVPTSS